MDAEALGVNGQVYEAQGVTGITGLSIQSRTGEAITITFNAYSTNDNPEVANTTAVYENGTITITLAQEAGDTTSTGAITATHADVKAALESVAGEAGIIVVEGDDFDGDGGVTTTPTDTTINAGDWELDEEASKQVGINISDQESASAAITTINDAIEKVSAERTKLGAYQNRLEHTINNLGTSAENLQAAESRIRDVDMAREIMEFTRANILSQASQAMLAQANQLPQSVLQLLG